MAATLLYGASSGALHAVTGPDHVLSLGPVALLHPRHSWRIGLRWGAGHALGTLLLALPVLWLSHYAHLPQMAAWGNRLAGLALMLTAVWSLRAQSVSSAHAVADARNPWIVGLVHGASGAGALMLMLPVLVSGSLERTLAFLIAFAFGSTLAMAVLTSAIAQLGQKLETSVIARSRKLLFAASFSLGLFWLLVP
jgi:nickel/cobalt exporter